MDSWDCTSCFMTPRLSPLNDHKRSSSPRVAVRNMAFDKRRDKSFNSIQNHKNDISQPSKKINNMRELKKALIKDNKEEAYSSWSLSTEEDFIVFCFRENNRAFDAVKNDNEMHQNSGPLKYGEEGAEQDNDCMTPSKEVEGIEDCGRMVSIESRDCNQSESRSGSFEFPVLGWEWIGSPVQMPKSKKDQHPKKHKARFRCCRFY